MAKPLSRNIIETAAEGYARIDPVDQTYMLTLIGDVMDISRLQTGNFMIRHEFMDAHYLVEKSCSGLIPWRRQNRSLWSTKYRLVLAFMGIPRCWDRSSRTC